METKKRVLVLGCGSLAATDVNMALRNNCEFEIYGASTYKNHGWYVYEKYICDLPNIKDDKFIDCLNETIKKYDLKFILPTHEDMTLYLQENKDKINATIVCSEYDTALLCRYKSKTYKRLEKYDFVPKVYEKEEVDSFPVFVKKDDDQGARHAYKVNNHEELDLYSKESNMLICEFLPGEEVTIDCFTNKEGKLLFCNPRAADRMLAGIDVHARRIERTKEIENIAESINKEIKFRGFWFFQIKKAANGQFKLLEISTRLPGAFSLSRCLDVNLPLLALKDFDGQEIKSISYNDLAIEADKQFFGKYEMNMKYDKVIIDLDSCFISERKVNTMLMMYIYQCINKGKEIIGITKNNKNIIGFFETNKVSPHVFSEIIEEDRYKYIEKSNINKTSILLSNDDAYRAFVRENKDIYCFSNGIIESLLDWRA